MNVIKSLVLAVVVFTPFFLATKGFGEKIGNTPAVDWILLFGCACLFLVLPSLRNQGIALMALSVLCNAVVLYFLAFYLMIHFFGEGL